MTNDVVTTSNGLPVEVNQALGQLIAFAERVQNNAITDINPSSMEPAKTPLVDRVNKSKFNAILESMSDDEVKATAFALCFNQKLQEAIQCYHNSVEHYAQVAAITLQLSKRGITINGQNEDQGDTSTQALTQ